MGIKALLARLVPLQFCSNEALQEVAFNRGYPMLLEHSEESCPVLDNPHEYNLHSDEMCIEAELDEVQTEAVQTLHEQAGHDTVFANNCFELCCRELRVADPWE